MSFYDKFTKYDKVAYHGVRLPEIIIDKKYYSQYDIDENVTNEQFLKELCNKKFKEIGLDKKPNKKEYISRVKMEMDIIVELGYVDYFLMIWDVVSWSESKGIATGTGRGSAGGSLIMYLLNVTKVDPLKHELFFERFISRSRARKFIVEGVTYFDGSLLCDVDTDFDYYRRHEVIKYIEQKYPNRVSKILTVTTLQGKLALKEAAKIAGDYEESDVKLLSDEVDTKFGKVDSMAMTLEKSALIKNWVSQPKEPHRIVSNKEIFDIACKIEGLPKNFGVHASAIAITYDIITDKIPIQKTKEGDIVSGFDMKAMAEISVKLDILGLKTLSIVDEVCREAGIKMMEINYEDEGIYKFTQNFNNSFGIFQLEADGQGSAVRSIKPSDINELSDVLAIARPGAMAYIKDYIKVKKGEVELPKIHPEWDRILAKSKGVSAYQEQMMQLGNLVFGFTLDESEMLRRACAKKKPEEIAKWQPRVYENATKLNLPKEMADAYWKLLEDSANYSFNKSHSVTYAVMSAITIYLKQNYPDLFFKSWLKMAKNEQDSAAQIAKISAELPAFGMNLLPPDLISSKEDFEIEIGNDGKKSIRFGLTSIKGISEKTLEKVLVFKGEGKVNKLEMFEAASKAELNIGTFCALIMSGAIDSICKSSRPRVVLEAQVWNTLSEKEKPYVSKYFNQFGEDVCNTIKGIFEGKIMMDNGKTPIFKDSRMETLRKKVIPFQEIWKMNNKNLGLANWYFERKLLGFSYTGTLYEHMSEDIDNLFAVTDFPDLDEKEYCAFAGIVTEVKKMKTAKKDNMMRVTIDDSGNLLNALFWGAKFDSWAEQNDTIKEDEIIIVYGQKSKDIVFLQDVMRPKQKIYMKFGELKKDKDNNSNE